MSSSETVDSDSHIKFFYGEGCPFTARAESSVNCLNTFLKVQYGQETGGVDRLEVYKNTENHRKYIEADGMQNCGGVPYFYNEKTGSSICGAATCDMLKMLATSKTKFQK